MARKCFGLEVALRRAPPRASRGLLGASPAEPSGKNWNVGVKRTPYFCASCFLGQLLAVEIGDLARADDIELQQMSNPLLDDSLDLGPGEIDQVHLLAIGAAAQLPHDGEALALRGGRFEVVAELEQALEKPGLVIEAVVAQGRRGDRRR